MSLSEAVHRALDFLRRRKVFYQRAFSSQDGQEVLIDLAKFARAGSAPWHKDADQRLVLIGRQEMWFRIQNHLNLSPQQLYQIYTGKTFDPNAEDRNA